MVREKDDRKKSDRPLALCPAVKAYFLKNFLSGDRDSRNSSPSPGSTERIHDSQTTQSLPTGKPSAGAEIKASSNEEILDAESGLYNFLSPVLNSDDGNTTASDTQSDKSGQSGSTNCTNVSPPLWYARGACLEKKSPERC